MSGTMGDMGVWGLATELHYKQKKDKQKASLNGIFSVITQSACCQNEFYLMSQRNSIM